MTAHNNYGFVFAATGAEYIALAIRAAKTVRQHNPNYQIDLFTDVPLENPIFDRVHMLKKSWHRPKMEALYRSRFERTIYLDADLFVLADVGDVFETLGNFDIAAAHDQYRNGNFGARQWKQKIPAAFPQYNGGVMAIKRTLETDRFLKEWEREISTANAPRDQPALRELLYSSNLRIATLPAEYNLMDIEKLHSWTSKNCAPRIIHHWRLHLHINNNMPQLHDLNALLGPKLDQHVNDLLAADKSLTDDTTVEPVSALCDASQDNTHGVKGLVRSLVRFMRRNG